MSDFWDDVSLGGNFVKFENPGDSITGTINKPPYLNQDNFGNTHPHVDLDTDDGDRTLSIQWNDLKAKFKEQRPKQGDQIYVKYVGEGEKQPGRNAPRLFQLSVNPAEHTPPDEAPW